MKNQKKIMLLIIIFIISLIVWLVTLKYEAGELNNEKIKICCNNNCFNVEIADDNESRQLWLMHRENLDDNKWMLFIYNKQWIRSFRMKNTLIPLAWIWLDSNLKIVDIKLMEPCKTKECPIYTSESEAQYILEINQRLIKEKWLLSTWDKCEIKF